MKEDIKQNLKLSISQESEMSKPSEKERIDEAIEICKNNPREQTFFDVYYSDVRDQVDDCLKKLSKIRGYNDEKIEYKIVDVDLTQKRSVNEKGECFFIQFTDDGYVVVVGAGYDYGMSKNDRCLNVKIINKLDKKWSNKAILVFVKGIKPVKGHCGEGPDDCKHLLQCRNGVEMYLGEYIERKIPILNLYSHKNYHIYSSEEWRKIVREIFSNNKIEK